MELFLQNQGLTFFRRHGARLKIDARALKIMKRYVQDQHEKPEAGGVLLGRYILDSADIVIDYATEPMKGDRRSRCRFFRAQRPHQSLIDRAWQDSGGTCAYLGEWHTHPEAVPIPSSLDKSDWRRKILTDQFSGSILFLIVGIKKIRVWEGHSGTSRFLELQEESLHV